MSHENEWIATLKKHYPHLIPERLWFSCGAGWYEILDSFFTDVDGIMDGRPGFRLSYVKEKMGSVRIHFDTPLGFPEADEKALYRAYSLASARSTHTCETCGKPGSMRNSSGWYFVACDDHANPDGRKSNVVPRGKGFLTTALRSDGGWSRYDPERDAFFDCESPFRGDE